MENDVTLPPNISEMLRASIEKSWEDPAKRRDLERVGVFSKRDLEAKLTKAIADPATRSFDRAPDSDKGQTDRSTIVQVKVLDRDKKEHSLTVVMEPERNEQGHLTGGTVRVDEQLQPSVFAAQLLEQYNDGQEPKVLMRGAALNWTEDQSQKSPISRLDSIVSGGDQPTYEREKQVTPEQQAKADIEAQNAKIKGIKPSFGQQGQSTTPASDREPTMVEKMQARRQEQDQKQETPAQQQKRAVTLNQGLTR